MVKLDWKLFHYPILISFRLNILVLGGDAGFVELYAYGMYKIATVTGVRLIIQLSIKSFTHTH